MEKAGLIHQSRLVPLGFQPQPQVIQVQLGSYKLAAAAGSYCIKCPMHVMHGARKLYRVTWEKRAYKTFQN